MRAQLTGEGGRVARPGGSRGRVTRRRTLGVLIASLALLATAGVTAQAASAAGVSGQEKYDLVVNGQKATMTEGQTATFTLNAVPPPTKPGTIRPLVDYTGNGGTITVTTSKGSYYWKVTAPCATNFLGSFSITDLTSGLGGGSTLAIGFSGSAPTSKLYNHRYSGTLSGNASNPIVGNCATTGPNNTIYQYKG